MEDSAIVDLYWQRSEQAIYETQQKYGRYCHSIAYNICGMSEDAEECVSETWFRAWGLMPDKRPMALSTFLGCITRSIAIDLIRTKNRKKRVGSEAELAMDELSECIPDKSDPEAEVLRQELENAVGCFVSGLSQAEKTVFILRYWHLVPVADISEKLGFSQSKIKSILFRSRKKLRKYLQEEELC